MNHCIVYFSKAEGLLEQGDLSTILQQSRRNNARTGVTGVLLYVRGSIIQVLEGEKEAVEALYRRIEQDPRHTQVSRALNRPIQERLFPNWSMGYETLTDQQLEDLKTTLGLEKPDEQASEVPDHIILKTLRVFYDSNKYN